MKKHLFYFAAMGWGLSLLIHLSALAGVAVVERIPFVWLLHVGIFAVWVPVVLELRKQQDLQHGSFLDRMNPMAFYRTVFKGTPPVLAVIGIAGFLYAMINFILFMGSQPGVAAVQDGQETSVKGSSSEVVRQQPDGSWRYIVDHPFGANAQA